MKRCMICAILAIAGISVAVAQDAAQASSQKSAVSKAGEKAKISLSDARGRISEAIASPAVMRAIMKQLSAEDQKQFLADVNKAIGDMPASIEEKTSMYLAVNTAAIRAAAPGNVATLIAETFATVSPEALTIINERFAVDLLSRTADPSVTYTDAQFTSIALKVMEVVNARCESTDNGSTRSAFAIMMLIRAAGQPIEGLTDKLIDTMLHEDAREYARSEWIPSALGLDGRTQNYEAILASANAGRRPDLDFVLIVAPLQFHTSVLQDIFGSNNDPSTAIYTHTPVLDAVENPLIHMAPNLGAEKPGQDPGKDEPRPYAGSLQGM